MSKSPRFEIDYETSDRITLLNLKDTMNYIIQENKKLSAKGLTADNHKQEFEYNTNMIKHFEEVIKHYGG